MHMNIMAERKRNMENKMADELFNPDSSGYDDITADSLREVHPLTAEKPTEKGKNIGDYVTSGEGDDRSFEAWVWTDHDGQDELDWYKHGASLDPRGMLLKGMEHPTIDLTIDMEEKRGYSFVKEDDGRYYSRPTPYRKDFERVVSNAPDELARVLSKQEGRTHYGLYTFKGEDGRPMFVSASADQWHKPRGFSLDDWMYKTARDKMEAGEIFPMDTDSGVSGWGTYRDLVEPTMQEKFVDKIMGR